MEAGEQNQAVVGRCALLTGSGWGAIGVVRFVGPGVVLFLQKHYSRPVSIGRLVHGELRAASVIDDAVVALLRPDVADVSVHGGSWVLREVLELAEGFGFEVARSDDGIVPLWAIEGETLLQREVEAWLPVARTEMALRALTSQPRAWDDWLASGPTVEQIHQCIADRSLWYLLHPPTVAIVGVANVGKSTLANQLFGQERSIVANVPGTTRDWVGEIANVDGLAVMLVDTPGRRASTDLLEQEAIGASLGQVRSADLVILMLDASRPMEEQAHLVAEHRTGVIVVNKVDLPRAWNTAGVAGIPTVAAQNMGIDAVRAQIKARFGCDRPPVDRAAWWTQRQQGLLQRSRNDVQALGGVLAPCGSGVC